MQVFLPYASFTHSVAVLDRARLGKQRVECGQLLSALRYLKTGEKVPAEYDVNIGPRGSNPGWINHPATKMWRGFESALALYMTLCVAEWAARGYKNSIVTPYNLDTLEPDPLHTDFAAASPAPRVRMPPWLGDADFHASHRAALLAKDPDWYSRYNWLEQPGVNYVWPV